MPTDTTVGGFNEAQAAAIFEPMAEFVLNCQLASLIIDTFLGGVLFMQVVQYFTYQWNDKMWTKCVVGYVAAMNLLVTIYYWVFSGYLFTKNFGYWLPWLEVRWLANMPVFDGGFHWLLGFFAYRAYLLLRRQIWIPIVCGILILGALSGAIGVKIVFGQQSSLLGATASGPTLITWLALTTAVDLLIAICIFVGLLRSRSGWAHTDKLVKRFIRLTFEAQLPPTFLAVAYVAEWIVQPSSLLGAVFQASLGTSTSLQCKAYTVGLLFTLNARIAFTQTISNEGDRTAGAPQLYGLSNRDAGRKTEIKVDVETETYVADPDKMTLNGSPRFSLPYDNSSRTHLADNPFRN